MGPGGSVGWGSGAYHTVPAGYAGGAQQTGTTQQQAAAVSAANWMPPAAAAGGNFPAASQPPGWCAAGSNGAAAQALNGVAAALQRPFTPTGSVRPGAGATGSPVAEPSAVMAGMGSTAQPQPGADAQQQPGALELNADLSSWVPGLSLTVRVKRHDCVSGGFEPPVQTAAAAAGQMPVQQRQPLPYQPLYAPNNELQQPQQQRYAQQQPPAVGGGMTGNRPPPGDAPFNTRVNPLFSAGNVGNSTPSRAMAGAADAGQQPSGMMMQAAAAPGAPNNLRGSTNTASQPAGQQSVDAICYAASTAADAVVAAVTHAVASLEQQQDGLPEGCCATVAATASLTTGPLGRQGAARGGVVGGSWSEESVHALHAHLAECCLQQHQWQQREGPHAQHQPEQQARWGAGAPVGAATSRVEVATSSAAATAPTATPPAAAQPSSRATEQPPAYASAAAGDEEASLLDLGWAVSGETSTSAAAGGGGGQTGVDQRLANSTTSSIALGLRPQSLLLAQQQPQAAEMAGGWGEQQQRQQQQQSAAVDL